MKSNPVVITPMDYHMGVDIARSLGRRGIPVYGIDPDPGQPGRSTRFAHFQVCPDPKESKEAFIQYLLDFGRKTLEQKAVLLAVRDNEVMIISEERQRLKEYYEIVMPEHATVAKLLTKDGLRQAAIECGIPAPQTAYPNNEHEAASAADGMQFPVILKPTESTYWHKPEIVKLLSEGAISGKAKVVLCRTKDELLTNYRKIAAHDPRMIVQEAIPGEDRQLVYFASYTDRQSQTIASFAGFAPADDPRFAILVVLDRPQKEQWGTQAAGPVFREIALQLLTLLDVPPDSVRLASLSGYAAR